MDNEQKQLTQTSDNGGESAFPGPRADGLTKREWFAGMALQGTLSNDQVSPLSNGVPRVTVRRALEFADLMLAELSAKEAKPKPAAPVDPMGKDFMRGVVSTERYANGQGLLSTLECGHINSGPISASSGVKPCLTCESNAKEGK